MIIDYGAKIQYKAVDILIGSCCIMKIDNRLLMRINAGSISSDDLPFVDLETGIIYWYSEGTYCNPINATVKVKE